MNTVKFGLRKISTVEFATFKDVEIVEDKIGLDLNFGFGVNEALKIIGCGANITFRTDGNPFIKLEVKCDFQVEPQTWDGFINNDTNEIVFPLSFILHLATITVGTARGTLHTKTESTAFNKFFLPTIDVTKSLMSDVAIPLGK